MGTPQMVQVIRMCRTAIRAHRDQRGDDRCWVDDYWLWKLVGGSPLQTLPTFEEGMKQCRDFFVHRNATQADTAPSNAIRDSSKWDDDLLHMSESELQNEWNRIHAAIQTHRDVNGRPRTLNDDRALYSVLPEKIPADFRLPPENEFLGEARAPHAGCPSFWRSHSNCPSNVHNLHRWGPCK